MDKLGNASLSSDPIIPAWSVERCGLVTGFQNEKVVHLEAGKERGKNGGIEWTEASCRHISMIS